MQTNKIQSKSGVPVSTESVSCQELFQTLYLTLLPEMLDNSSASENHFSSSQAPDFELLHKPGRDMRLQAGGRNPFEILGAVSLPQGRKEGSE